MAPQAKRTLSANSASSLFDAGCYRKYVVNDPDLFRPAEVNLLLGDSAKARAAFGWNNRIGFADLVREMVEEDCRALGAGSFVPAAVPAK